MQLIIAHWQACKSATWPHLRDAATFTCKQGGAVLHGYTLRDTAASTCKQGNIAHTSLAHMCMLTRCATRVAAHCVCASFAGDQPMGDEETLQGARNRATACRDHLDARDAAFTVGIEGGCKIIDGKMACMAWMCVQAADGVEGVGCAALFFLPKSMSRLVESGASCLTVAHIPGRHTCLICATISKLNSVCWCCCVCCCLYVVAVVVLVPRLWNICRCGGGGGGGMWWWLVVVIMDAVVVVVIMDAVVVVMVVVVMVVARHWVVWSSARCVHINSHRVS
jgi:hypothetical protein